MKMPIRHKYFEEIKSGKKWLDSRDAHISFIDEETGEILIKKVWSCYTQKTSQISELNQIEKDEMFTDDLVIVFCLEEYEMPKPKQKKVIPFDEAKSEVIVLPETKNEAGLNVID